MNPRLQFLTNDMCQMTPVAATKKWPDGTLLDESAANYKAP